jgi:hypothetical protein
MKIELEVSDIERKARMAFSAKGGYRSSHTYLRPLLNI